MVKEDAFADTSAVVKRYHAEVGSAWTKRLWGRKDVRLWISSLTLLEFKSAFARKVRTGDISLATFRRVLRRFSADIANGRYDVVHISRSHWALAGKLIQKHGPRRALRTLDAIQLSVATHILMRRGIDEFITADQSLAACAALEHFAVVNPERQP